MKIKHIKFVLSLLLVLGMLISNTITVFAGADPSSLSKDELNTAKLLYDYMTKNGYTKEAACGVLGNVDQETGFENMKGSFSGYFQMSTSLWGNYQKWLTEHSLKDNIINQFKFLEAHIKDDIEDFTTTNLKKFKTSTDVVWTTECFMCAVERCVTKSGPEEDQLKYQNLISEKYNKANCGGKGLYQQRGTRVKYAKAFATNKDFANLKVEDIDEGSDSAGSDSSTSSENSSVKVDSEGNFLVETRYGEWIQVEELNVEDKFILAADRDNLTSDELNSLRNWNDNIGDKSLLSYAILFLRKLVVLVGIASTLWGILFYMAFWFDRLNNVIDIRFTKFLSFNKLEASFTDNPEESTYHTDSKTDAAKLIIHRQCIKIVLIAEFAGAILISGKYYDIIRTLVNFIRHFFE